LNFYKPNTTPDSHIVSGNSELTNLPNSLWRGKWFILIFVLICIIAADFYTRRVAIPLYPATAKIALQEGQPRKILTDIESVMSNGPISITGIKTELEVLQSRDLIGQLVDLLDLTNQAAFNKHLRGPSLFNQFITEFFEVFNLAPESPKSTPTSEEVRSTVISSVISAMNFSNTRNTLVINISATTNNAALSVVMANTMATLYIKNQIQVKLDVLSSATDFLSGRTSELKYEYEKLKTELSNFSNQSELVNLNILEAEEIQLRDIRTRLLETTEIVEKKSQMLKILQSHKENNDLDAFISIADDFRLNRAISKYLNNKIFIDDLNLEVDRFMILIEAEAVRDKKQLSALKSSELQLANQIERQSKELIILQQLERETEAARLLYESFFTRLLEMNVQLGLETADGRILSKAILSGPSSPIKIQVLSIASFIGLMLGVFCVALREIRFSGYRSINDLRDRSGHKVLASVPLIPKRDRKSVMSYLNEKPNSLISEAVRNLRTSILMSNPDKVPQVIMLTSSIPEEGKTVLTFALAKNMVGLGKRVLLIEADIRRTVNSVDIDRKNTVKLLDLLTGGQELKNVSPFVESLGFSVLSGSKSNMNAADLFSAQSFSKLLSELRDHYDYILIDTPPVLAVPDARIIGAKSDANIYIVEWNKTTRLQVDQGIDMFLSIGVNITGLVLNQIDPHKMKTYGTVSQYGYDIEGAEYYDN